MRFEGGAGRRAWHGLGLLVALVCLLAGCGRINFDALGSGDAPPSTSDGTSDGASACWIHLSSGPARRAHVAAYDPLRDRIVLFGGSDGATTHGDTWEWDGSVWNALAPGQSPVGRTTPAMTFDAGPGQTMLVGGFDGNVLRADTWEWNGAIWNMVGSAPARSDHAIVYRAANSRVVMFGGYNNGLPLVQCSRIARLIVGSSRRDRG